MEKIKIVHASDLHFDTPFKDVGEKQSEINKEELKEVFVNIIHFCKDNSVDILLLSGDIFDNFTVNKNTIYFLENAFDKLYKTKVFISPGNHDPYGNNSFYKLVNWPNNVYIFKDGIEKVYLDDLDINVFGAGFREKYIKKSILDGFSYDDKKINLMVIHGELSNDSGGNEYNPITYRDISMSGMDYIAIGHRHTFSGIQKEGNTFYAYSGCPQGRGFDELGDKGIIYGYVSKGAVELDFVKTSKRNYEEVEVDISNKFGYEEVKDIILNSVNEEDRKNNLYKIILKGDIDESFSLDENILAKKLEADFFFVKIIDKTKVKIDIEEISKGYSVKGIFAKKLMNKLYLAENEEEKEVISLALKLGLSSLSEDEVKMDDY